MGLQQGEPPNAPVRPPTPPERKGAPDAAVRVHTHTKEKGPDAPKRSRAPHPKLVGSTIAGAVVVVLAWLAGLAGVEVPPDVQKALVVLVGFFVGYLVPSN